MPSSDKHHIVLASASPRRKEIMQYLDLPFTIVPSDADEKTDAKIPKMYVERVALQKGTDVLNKVSSREFPGQPLVVASDTVVALEGKILLKPENQSVARKYLQMLSGQKHEVHTSVFIGNQNKEMTFSCCTEVTFQKIDPILMERYLKTNDSLDKAGAYGIQGMASSFIKEINGSYHNVVGFPISQFFLHLREFVGDEDWQNKFV